MGGSQKKRDDPWRLPPDDAPKEEWRDTTIRLKEALVRLSAEGRRRRGLVRHLRQDIEDKDLALSRRRQTIEELTARIEEYEADLWLNVRTSISRLLRRK